MSKELYDNRKKDFKNFVIRMERLPRMWEIRFSDSEDMRLWFNKISKLTDFQDFVIEINNILKEYDSKILNDKEREEEFLNYISHYNQIPLRNQSYFSDNEEMYSWYMRYKEKHDDFETTVHNRLPEYQDLDLAGIWSDIKKEFLSIVKRLKRIPNHGEIILQNGIDVRVVFDKLETYNPEFAEKLLLHLETYKTNSLSLDDRVIELLACVTKLGYVPYLQESRFSDGTDMFTWYNTYKESMPSLEIEVNSRIKKELPKRKINIYLIPNFKNTGGKFYTICTNVGEKLDLSEISSFEEAKKLDPNLVKRGGVILKQDEEIDSVSFVKGKTKK